MPALLRIFVVLFLIGVQSLFAQQPFFNIYQDNAAHWGTTIKIHPNGQYYINGTVQSGDNSTADWILMETDALGNISWTRSWGTAHRNVSKPMIIGSDDHLYLPGWIELSAGTIRDDWAIFKITPTGQGIWDKYFGSGSNFDDELEGVIETQDNQLLWFGSHSPTSNTQEGNGSIVKTDFAGNQQWVREYEAPGKQAVYGVEALPGGGFICVGYTAATPSNSHLWLVKLDNDGKMLWNKTFGSSVRLGTAGIHVNPDGTFVMSTQVAGGLTGEDALILKTSSIGDLLWSRRIGGPGNDRAKLEGKTKDGGYLFSGFTYSYGFRGKDGWVFKLDEQGDFIWAKAYGTEGIDQIWDLEITPDGFVATGSINTNNKNELIIFKANAQGETDPCYMKTISPQVIPITLAEGLEGQDSPFSFAATHSFMPTPYSPEVLNFTFDAQGNSPLCVGDQLTLSAQTSHPATFTWTGPHNFSSTQQNPSRSNITAADFGQYIVTLSFYGCEYRDTVTVTGGSSSGNLGPDTTLCAGDSVEINLSMMGASFLWQDGSTDASYTINMPGTYWVEITIGTCILADTLVVSEILSPVPFSLGADSIFCEKEIIVLDASQPGVFDYLWQDHSQNPIFEVTESGEYEVTVSNECGSEVDKIFLDRTDLPVLVLPQDSVLCEGESLDIQSVSNGGILVWGNGFIGPSLFVNESGLYNAAIENKCGVTRDSIKVSYKNCDCNVYMPNAFSPNGDNRNDVFSVSYFCSMTDFQFMIFNRWGEKIFTANNPEQAWDGKHKGWDCPEGVYVWVVGFQGEYFRKYFPYQRTGTVTLIR